MNKELKTALELIDEVSSKVYYNLALHQVSLSNTTMYNVPVDKTLLKYLYFTHHKIFVFIVECLMVYVKDGIKG